MRRLIQVGVCCAIVSCVGAGAASAQVIRWIDKLSGPGPFIGFQVEGRVVCWGAPESDEEMVGVKLPCLIKRGPKDTPRRTSLNVEAGVFWARDNELPYNRDLDEDERRVMLTPLQVTFYWQPLRGLELGHGAGLFFFYSKRDLFDRFTRFALEPLRVDIRPFDLAMRDPARRDKLSARLLRMITLRQSIVILPKGVTAADFGALGSFRTSREILPSYSLLLDIEPLFTKGKG
jgi:hypothetical protein